MSHRHEGKDGQSVVANPQFINPGINDFSDMSASSPSFALGFVPISVSAVGPFQSTWHSRHTMKDESMQRIAPLTQFIQN